MKWIIYGETVINLHHITTWWGCKRDDPSYELPFVITFEVKDQTVLEIDFPSKEIQEKCFNEIITFIKNKNSIFFIIPEY